MRLDPDRADRDAIPLHRPDEETPAVEPLLFVSAYHPCRLCDDAGNVHVVDPERPWTPRPVRCPVCRGTHRVRVATPWDQRP
jgi:hypothetical protein